MQSRIVGGVAGGGRVAGVGCVARFSARVRGCACLWTRIAQRPPPLAPPQAFQYNEKHGEVCPAGWTPGAKTMVASPEKSAAYFAGVEDGDDWPAGKITAVRSKAELAAAVGGKGKVFVEYVAPWCGKCAMMAPTIAALSESRGDVKFLKVDTTADGLTSAAADASVLALPTFRFYKDGAQVGADITGFKRAVVEEAMAKF